MIWMVIITAGEPVAGSIVSYQMSTKLEYYPDTIGSYYVLNLVLSYYRTAQYRTYAYVRVGSYAAARAYRVAIAPIMQ
eukprot:SAG31_NODE_2440_length_5690_cov_23.385262_1_plen_78_part_00